MLINSTSLDLVFRGFSAKYRDAYVNAPVHGDRIAMTMPSEGREETYAWFGQFPNLREWIGARVVQNLSASQFTIVNRKFESTVEVSRDHISDDRLGVFGPVFAEMGLMAAQHRDELIFGLLASGFTTNGYDGQFFFDTDHPVVGADGATVSQVSNFGGGAGTPWFLLDTSRAVKPIIWQERESYEFTTLTRPDDAHVFMTDQYVYGVRARVNAGFGLWQMAYASRQTLTAANYAAARAAMMGLRADGGRPLGIRPTVMIVPPSLEEAALGILNTEYGASGASNVWKGTAEVIVAPYLA